MAECVCAWGCKYISGFVNACKRVEVVFSELLCENPWLNRAGTWGICRARWGGGRLMKVCWALENIEYLKKRWRYIYLNCTQDIWKHLGNKLLLQYQRNNIYVTPFNSALVLQGLRACDKIQLSTQSGSLDAAEEPPTSRWGQAVSLLSRAPCNSGSAAGIEQFPLSTRASRALWSSPKTSRGCSTEAVVIWRLMRMDNQFPSASGRQDYSYNNFEVPHEIFL